MSVIEAEAPAKRSTKASQGGARHQFWAWPSLLLSLQIGFLIAMAGSVATRLWQDHAWVGYLLFLGAIVCWAPEVRRTRARRWWFVYVVGTFAYTLLRSYADETRVPIHVMYPIDLDRAIFLGVEPVSWLQMRLFSPARVSALDWAAVLVHWSFFLAPHAGAVAVFLWRRDLFSRYTVVVVGTMYLGLLLFFAVPTAPPWLAGQAGNLPDVFRVMDFVGGRVDSETYRSFYASLGEPNSVAAMPSIHMGVTFAMFLWARDHHPRIARLLLVYSFAMAFALIYLAEHYLVDLLACMLCATICCLASKRLISVPEEVGA